MAIPEELGAFYLGRRRDVERGETTPEPILYDAKDLLTHAVIVGMTGSGKTGLGVTLLEEAALDGIPAIVIDPKGDMGNLALQFPELRPEDFAPWIDLEEAGRAGNTLDEHAREISQRWRDGISSWDQGPDRIKRLQQAAEVVLYTPGAQAGRSVSVLRSFDAPSPELLADGDALRERVAATVSGLLALLGIAADPVRSREHILLSRILHDAWSAGRSLDLAGLIRALQEPGFERVGVLDLDSFFPSKDRFELAMSVNNLLASPGFAAWMEGDPLDVRRLLHAPDGRPRISVLSIAHLSETERMFFVTLLLNEVVSWMRSQPGTQSLRALLYMDEVFGYLPPTANPPSKIPMLTLLKQARAYGLGCVLATQNPVDLDYKALSNTGTWFLGRLQTERDKARVIEGLEGASSSTGAAFDKPAMERVLAGLGSRTFLMNNVHEDQPVLFQTRYALSYLRGPLTREQIRKLVGRDEPAAATDRAPAPQTAAAATRPAAAKPPSGDDDARERPVLPAEIDELFLAESGVNETPTYAPGLYVEANLHYARVREKVDTWTELHWFAPFSGDDDPEFEEGLTLEQVVLGDAPAPGARFDELPGSAANPKRYTTWGKKAKSHLYREHPLLLWRCTALKEVSRPGETEGDFRVRLRQRLREERDLAIEKLRKRFAPKLARAQERIRKSEERLDREESQYRSSKMSTAVSVGATVLGAIFGRKLGSVGNVGRAGTAARGASRTARERSDVERAKQDIVAQEKKLADLETQLESDLEKVRERLHEDGLELREVRIPPRKGDLTFDRLALAWRPR